MALSTKTPVITSVDNFGHPGESTYPEISDLNGGFNEKIIEQNREFSIATFDSRRERADIAIRFDASYMCINNVVIYIYIYNCIWPGPQAFKHVWRLQEI